MSEAGKRLISSALQARKIARGESEPASVHVPPEMDVKAIRGKLQLTQDDFASEFGFTVTQVRDWEQARHRPIGAIRAYLLLIDRNPDIIRRILREARAETMPPDNQDDHRIAM